MLVLVVLLVCSALIHHAIPPVLDLPSVIASMIIVYLIIVRILRWRVYNKIHETYRPKFVSQTLTPADAQKIMLASTCWDMPSLLTYGLVFALVRTYGVPTISRTLLRSKELKSKESLTKRFLDTAILGATWTLCPLGAADGSGAAGLTSEDDPRAFIAIARVNWLHSHYSISNEDYLYTLSLFITEPIRWAKQYGWRELSPLEQQARFIFYRQIGIYMGIQSIPDTLEEFAAWAESYEQESMVPAQSNHELVDGILCEISARAPRPLQGPIRQFIVCLLPDRLHRATQLPDPPRWMNMVVEGTMRLVAFTHGFLSLPRRKPSLRVPVDTPHPRGDGKLQRMHPNWKVSEPWYQPRSTGLRLAFQRLALLTGLLKEDQVSGPRWRSDGYRLEELGPLVWENAGHEDVMRMATEMTGCPIEGIWAR